MKTMAALMLFFAFVIGYATIIENDYGAMTAKADVYSTKWFELLLATLGVILVLNIQKYKMYTMNKASIFIFHVAFLVILFGAAITRFYGFEGSMHIRQGETVSTMTSLETYFKASTSSGDKTTTYEKSLYLSKRSTNHISTSLEVDGKTVDVELVEYIPDAVETIVEDKVNGIPIANMMITINGKGEPVKLKVGDSFESSDFVLDFNSTKTFSKPVISLYVENDTLMMKHDIALTYMKMDDGSKGDLTPTSEPLLRRTLYTGGQSNFVLREFLPHAGTKIVKNPKATPKRAGEDALRFKVTVGDETQEVLVVGQSGVLANETHNVINGVDVHLSYGAKTLQLPFALKLVAFELDRYPGSMSPASYASEVLLIDKEKKLETPYRIFMNNILEHRGYRFFQSSYDQDEQGTILSVNNDPGTLPTYLGYLLLGIGMFWSLLSKKNRFAQLAKKAQKANETKALGFLLSLGLLFTITPSYAEELNPAIKTMLAFDKEHAKKFGELIIQDSNGRMKPLDTRATEILAKIHRSATLSVGSANLTADQVVLGMMITPNVYRDIKMIRTKDKGVNEVLGLKGDALNASFSEFFEDPINMRGYKLATLVDTAVRKQAKHRDKFDKAILQIDERVNIAYMVFTGELIKIWPKPNDMNNKWFGTMEALKTMSPEDVQRLRTLAVVYFTAIDASLQNGDWSEADTALSKIAEYQKFYGAEVYPSQSRISAEVFYNEAKIFERIYPLYLLLGFILLILSFVKILKPSFNIDIYTKITLVALVILFIAHTIGLANRWYISGHAPWSNGYESMIYIGWASILAGFIFSKRSSMTMASTGILAGLILFVAHLNWMDPQVTNLVPVLNSYWLSIHVSMITASYGFLGLGALLGFITIILFILKNPKNEKHITLSIKELNAINEMTLMVGLALLTVGNFLGGVWANESWGRYWGWNPKETWALVTILVYAAVLHLRFIKSIYTEFNYSVISLLSFTTVLMTYFGVNYYLAGLHSYAKGDPVPIPDFVPITYLIVFVVIALAFRNRKLA